MHATDDFSVKFSLNDAALHKTKDALNVWQISVSGNGDDCYKE
jgi:hypothetical protein